MRTKHGEWDAGGAENLKTGMFSASSRYELSTVKSGDDLRCSEINNNFTLTAGVTYVSNY